MLITRGYGRGAGLIITRGYGRYGLREAVYTFYRIVQKSFQTVRTTVFTRAKVA